MTICRYLGCLVFFLGHGHYSTHYHNQSPGWVEHHGKRPMGPASRFLFEFRAESNHFSTTFNSYKMKAYALLVCVWSQIASISSSSLFKSAGVFPFPWRLPFQSPSGLQLVAYWIYVNEHPLYGFQARPIAFLSRPIIFGTFKCQYIWIGCRHV